MKLAVGLTKSLNVSSLNYSTFAYHFVQRAPGSVIRNLFELFQAVAEVLSERIDNETVKDWDEYHCGIASKRIIDALAVYDENA